MAIVQLRHKQMHWFLFTTFLFYLRTHSFFYTLCLTHPLTQTFTQAHTSSIHTHIHTLMNALGPTRETPSV